MPPFAKGLRFWSIGGWSRNCNGGGWGLRVAISTQSSDSIQQLAAVPQRCDAKLLEVLPRQVGQDVSSISFSRNAASYLPSPGSAARPQCP